MLLKRYGRFSGGIALPAENRQTVRSPVKPLPLPARLLVPLACPPGPAATPVVQPGQAVAAGQLIAQPPHPTDMTVYAPLAATVGQLTQAQVATGNDMHTVDAMELIDPIMHGNARRIFRLDEKEKTLQDAPWKKS